MINLWLGVATVAVATVLFWLAWLRRGTEHGRGALLLIVLAGLILRVYAATDLYLHPWDERFHALVAKSLMQHPLEPALYDVPLLDYDYRHWFANHVWLHKQPLPLWAMAGSMRLFGVNEIGLRLPSILLSTLAIFLTYRIGVLLWGRRVGLLAAFLHAIDGQTIDLTAGRAPTDHYDLFHLVLIELAVLGSVYYVRRRPTALMSIFIGICIGLAILTKWLTALVVIPVWLLLSRDRRGNSRLLVHVLLALIVSAAVALPWQLHIRQQYPREAAWEAEYNRRHVTEVLEEHDGGVFFHLERLGRVHGELVYIPLLWIAVEVFRRWRRTRHSAVFIWVALPLLFFSLAKTKMPAYTSVVAPAIFLMTALFLVYASWIRTRVRHRGLMTLIIALVVVLPVRYSVERLKAFKIRERNPEWAQQLRSVDTRIPERHAVVFGTERPIELMFYSSHVAYPFSPSEAQLETVRRKGYTPYLFEDGNVVRVEASE